MMKILYTAILVLTILLSLATGLFKLMQQPADIELFQKIGLEKIGTTVLGAIQFTGGILLSFLRTRKLGAIVMATTFVLASVAVFANELYGFGAFSLLFIAMALFIYMRRDGN
jgi:hypothetical protein